MNQNPSDTIDAIIENFDAHDEDVPKTECVPVTFWLPEDYKLKYDHLQRDTRRRFGKVLKTVLMRAIDMKTGS